MDEKTLKRFWSRVNKNGPIPPHAPHLGNCWVWTAGRATSEGYGGFGISGVISSRRWMLTHRVSWIIANGDLPEGRVLVLHHCDNPPCVNPSHLFLGSHADNMRDLATKGRRAIHSEQSIRTVFALSKLGLSSKDIGTVLGMHPRTPYRYLSRKLRASITQR